MSEAERAVANIDRSPEQQQRQAALDALREGAREGVREGMRDGMRSSALPPTTMNISLNQEQRPQQQRQPGDKFAACEYCNAVVHYASNPKICARPYRPCNNNCTSKKPKAIHLSCIEELVRKCRNRAFMRREEENEDDDDDEGPVGFECDVCHGKFEVDIDRSTRNMLVNLFCNTAAFVVLVLFLLFLSTGIVWQYLQFRAIVNGDLPPDPINNQALIYLNKTSHTEMVRRPIWAEFRSYNHCVATDAAERIIYQQWLLLSTEEEAERQDKFATLGTMGIEERLSAMYALLKENGDPDSLSKYYWLCGGVGWWGKIGDYIETCFYATGYLWYAVIIVSLALFFLRALDKCCCDGGMLRAMWRSRTRAVILVDGKRVRLSGRSSSANQRRKLSMKSMHKS